MAENDSAVADATTPAEPSVESTPTEQPDAFVQADPWGDLGKESTEQEPEKEPVQEPEKEPVDEPKTDEKPDSGEDVPLEDKAIEEAFGEPKEEPDIDAQDPKKMSELQETATAKAYLERASRVYDPAKDFKHGRIDAGEYSKKFTDFIGEEKAREFAQHEAHSLVDANPDAAFKRAFAVQMLKADPNWKGDLPDLVDVIKNGNKPSETVELPPLTELTADLDKTLDWNWRDESLDDNFADERELALARTLRAVEAKAKTDAAGAADLKQKLEAATEQLKGVEKAKTEDQTAAIRTQLTEITTNYKKGVADKILPIIAKNTGLEISKDDTPEIVAFKQRKLELYTGTEYQKNRNEDSRFEEFAYNESSVKTQLEEVVTRLIDAQLQEAQAKLSGNKADEQKYHAEAEDEKIPLINLLGQANKEFAARYIKPDMELMGQLSTNLAAPIQEARERQEIVSNGAAAPQVKKQEYRTAEDVWDSMPIEAEKEDVLRANA